MPEKFIGKRVQVEYAVMNARVPRKVQDRISPKVKAGRCIIQDCDREAAARGLCATCRAASKAAINNGSVTEEELIREGMLLPEQTRGRKARSKFAQQLESRTG